MTSLVSWHEVYKTWLNSFDYTSTTVALIYNISIVTIAFLLGILAYKVGKPLIFKLTRRFLQRKEYRLTYRLYRNKFFSYLSYYFPLLIMNYCLSIVIPTHKQNFAFLGKISDVLAIFLFIMIVNSILKTVVDLNQYKKENRSKPIKGFIQFIQIIIFFLGTIICISILVTDSPLKLIGGLGAMSAVLMLIFKDSIMGLVGGVQLSLNKTIVIGDWIMLPKYDVDGEVIDITLTSIKVQNWDNSISTVPSYNLVVSDSIKNWQNMRKMGARLISRAINIDMNSIRFCTPEMIQHYEQKEGVKEVLKVLVEKPDDLDENAATLREEQGLTNFKVFRAYMYSYLNKKEGIRKDMDIVLKEKPPTLNGLPFEIYCYTEAVQAIEHEAVKADIFDHMLAILPFFGLKICQSANIIDTSAV